MSELRRTPEATQTATIITQAIREDWQEFETLAAQPGAQEYCAFVKRYNEAWEHESGEVADFDPPVTSFSAREAAALFKQSQERFDLIVQTLVDAYRVQKRRPTEEAGPILANIFGGGVDKIYKYLQKAGLLDIDQAQHLPFTLLAIAGQIGALQYYEQTSEVTLEADLPPDEIDAITDSLLQKACQQIRQDKKFALAKGAPEPERVFAHSMNCLRTLYYKGRDKGFMVFTQDRWLADYMDRTRYYVNREDYETDEEYYRVWEDAAYCDFAQYFNRRLGCEFPIPLDIAKIWAAIEKSQNFQERTSDEDRKILFPKEMRHDLDTMSIHATRHFVDAIAEGRLKYSQIMHAAMHLSRQPLVARQLPEVVVPDIGLDWEVLPWELVMSGESDYPPLPELDVNKPEHPRNLDWSRIIRLRNHIIEWGGGYIARTVPSSETPGLSLRPDQQYYVAVLPQADGTEHAIADHPEVGKNGIYMWRAETRHITSIVGRNRDLTWREVLCHPKKIARSLGARCLYHSKHVEYNVLDYLTCPPEKIPTRRYAVGRGAMRMARIARQGSRLLDVV